jgi:hypothetical protein
VLRDESLEIPIAGGGEKRRTHEVSHATAFGGEHRRTLGAGEDVRVLRR